MSSNALTGANYTTPTMDNASVRPTTRAKGSSRGGLGLSQASESNAWAATGIAGRGWRFNSFPAVLGRERHGAAPTQNVSPGKLRRKICSAEQRKIFFWVD